MNPNRYYKIIAIIGIILLNIVPLVAKVHKPKGNEDKIKLIINGKDRIYYELDNNGLDYKEIGKKYIEGDSIRIGLHSRTIKSSTGKRSKNYGFSIQVDNGKTYKLKYKKSGSKVTSRERPGWYYTESGIWYLYLPYKKNGYNIKVKPLKGNPVVYLRLSSKKLNKKGKYVEVLKTVNRQDRWRIETVKGSNNKTTYWYPLNNKSQQQYEITGPATVRVFSRLEFQGSESKDIYYMRIKEDGYDLGTYYFESELSDKSYVAKNQKGVGKWRSIWINVPKGKHYYTFTLPNIDDNQNKNLYIRIKQWETQ